MSKAAAAVSTTDVKSSGTTRSGRKYAATNETDVELSVLSSPMPEVGRRFNLKDEVCVYHIRLIPVPINLNSDTFAGRIMDTLRMEAKKSDEILIRAIITPSGPSSPGRYDLQLAFLGDGHDTVLMTANLLNSQFWTGATLYSASELTLACRYEGEYSDCRYPLIGMPVEWMSDFYKSPDAFGVIETAIHRVKPESLKAFFERLAPNKTIKWANIMCKSDTVISLDYVQFKSVLAKGLCARA
jgi:hypothetical protein